MQSSKPTITSICLCAAALLTAFYAHPALGGGNEEEDLAWPVAPPAAPQSVPAPAARSKADPRVARAFQESETPWAVEVDKDGFYTVGMSTEQVFIMSDVTISSATTKSFNGEWLNISSIAYWNWKKGDLSPEEEMKLLEENSKTFRGAWGIYQQDGKTAVIYCLQVPANAKNEELEEAVKWVGSVAHAKYVAEFE